MPDQDPSPNKESEHPPALARGVSPAEATGWAAKAAQWAQANKAVVTVVSVLALGGSLAVSFLPDDKASSSAASGGLPAFEAPPRAKSPTLRRADPASMIRQPSDMQEPGASGEVQAPAEEGVEPSAVQEEGVLPGSGIANPAGGSARKAFELKTGVGKGGDSGGGGGGPSISGGRGGEGAQRDAALSAAAPGGALAFVKRQLSNAGKRVARILGSQPGRNQGVGSGPSGHALGSAGGASTTRFDSAIAGGGAPTGATGATSPGGPNPAPAGGPSSHSPSGGGAGSPTESKSSPAGAAAATKQDPKKGEGKDKDKKEEEAGPCSKDKNSTRCAVLTCVADLDAWPINRDLAIGLHAADEGLGLIVPHHQKLQPPVDAAKAKLDEVQQYLAGLSFDCEECASLQACRNASIPFIDKARKKAEDSTKLLPQAITECEKVPFKLKQDGSRCKQLGDQVKAADEELGKAVQEMARAGECSGSGPEEEVARWNAWASTVRGAVAELKKTFEKPFCPERTKCDPGPRAPAFQKMEKGTKDIEVFQGDLPTVITLLSQARRYNAEALGHLAKAATDEGAVRELVLANDRAALAVTQAREAFEVAKAQACGGAPGSQSPGTGTGTGTTRPSRERASPRDRAY